MPTSSPSDPVSLIGTFHERLNAHDVAAVLAMAADDIELGGPRGSGSGKALLEEWIARASITLRPTRWFASGETVVVEQAATWETSGRDDAPAQTVATVFTVRDGLVARMARYGDIGEAVTSAGLDEDDETVARS